MTWILAAVELVAIAWLVSLTTGWWKLHRLLRELRALYERDLTMPAERGDETDGL